MKYDEIFARSFSRHDQKRLRYGALVACFVVLCCFCIVFKPYVAPLPALNFRLTMVDGLKLVMVGDETSEPERPHVEIKETKLVCNVSTKRSDTCEMTGDVRIQGMTSTIYMLSPHTTNEASWTIKPYARKGDETAMNTITNFTVKAVPEHMRTVPDCTQTHDVPAVVFSVGGYAGNNFHDFADVILPLYATSREFNGEVRFLMANSRARWTSKFKELLEKLSNYEVINIDHENEVHCFPSMIVGLRKDPKELQTDSVKEFTRFLRSSYSLKRSTAMKLTNTTTKQRPRLLVVSRQKTRAFTNKEEVVRAAEESGFEVVVTEINANLSQVSRVVNSCDVMMGVHGAGLTNMVFLPENGVLIQVVPLGKMGWLANTYFGEPSKAMGLKYLEYHISEGESSLIDQYPLDHQVFRDPFVIQRKGWEAFRSIYLDKQNVKLDVGKFKDTLSKALQFLHQ